MNLEWRGMSLLRPGIVKQHNFNTMPEPAYIHDM